MASLAAAIGRLTTSHVLAAKCGCMYSELNRSRDGGHLAILSIASFVFFPTRDHGSLQPRRQHYSQVPSSIIGEPHGFARQTS